MKDILFIIAALLCVVAIIVVAVIVATSVLVLFDTITKSVHKLVNHITSRG